MLFVMTAPFSLTTTAYLFVVLMLLNFIVTLTSSTVMVLPITLFVMFEYLEPDFNSIEHIMLLSMFDGEIMVNLFVTVFLTNVTLGFDIFKSLNVLLYAIAPF